MQNTEKEHKRRRNDDHHGEGSFRLGKICDDKEYDHDSDTDEIYVYHYVFVLNTDSVRCSSGIFSIDTQSI